MKTIHINKIAAITEMKTRAFFKKNCIIMPIFAIGCTIMYRFLFQNVANDGTFNAVLNGEALAMGLVTNIGGNGIYCCSLLLAEEKEKKTLRVLMTSSVNALEFFLGSILPVFFFTSVINFLLVPISGMTLTLTQWIWFTVMTILGTLTSCILGMLLGIFAKDQVSTSTITTPFILTLMLVPMFSTIIESFKTVSHFIFTGAIMEMISNIASHQTPYVELSGMIVMVIEIILAILLFIFFYKKNGYEKD